MYKFDVLKVKNECVEWIRNFFEENGKGCNAVVGISGGKDSSIVAALCVEALGKDRVIGVLMPCGEQHDIDCAKQLVDHLGIKHYIVNIKDTVDDAMKFFAKDASSSESSTSDLFPKIFACPVCSKKLKATKSGRFRCSECKTILAIDNQGQVFLG